MEITYFQRQFVRAEGFRSFILAWKMRNVGAGKIECVVKEIEIPRGMKITDRGDYVEGRKWEEGDVAWFREIGWRIALSVDPKGNPFCWTNIFKRM